LNGREQIPEKAWRTEREKLLAERYVLVDEFYALKEDVRIVEVLQRGAEDIMRDITPDRTAARAQGLGL
jgi:hypothetical protein